MKCVPIVAVADLHGHSLHLDRLVAWCDTNLGDHILVPLGDYCDNGPDVPGLIDRLIALRAERGDRVRPILGNHDLACLRAIEDDGWFARWGQRYWNGVEMGTPYQYRSMDAGSFRDRFPATHRDFLGSLPWFLDLDGFLFVHAGLEKGPIEPQLPQLAMKVLPVERFHMPLPLRDKERLSRMSDPDWDRIVVSAHNRHLPEPAFAAPKRLCLSACVEDNGCVYAVILPAGRFLRIDGKGDVTEVRGVRGWRRLGLPRALAAGKILDADDQVVIPLLAGDAPQVRYLTLPRALSDGLAEIREKGEVRSLVIENHAALPILCLDGELVKGGLQDRVLDRPVWIPAGKAKSVAVSCVEQGRWAATDGGAAFSHAGTTVDPALRHARMASREDQGTTWQKVGERRRSAGLANPSGSLLEGQEAREKVARERITRLPPPDGARGFAIGRRPGPHQSRFPLVVFMADSEAMMDVWAPLLLSVLGASNEGSAPPIPLTDVAALIEKLDQPDEIEVVEQDDGVEVIRTKRHDMLGWAVRVDRVLVYVGAVRP